MALCAHCLLDIPSAGAVSAEFDGTERLFCCPGCLAVFRLIRREGLGRFYESRRGWTPGPPEGIATDPADFEDHVHESGGEREAEIGVAGLRCASCVWLVEKAIGRLPGVTFVRVGHATGRARIRWRDAADGTGLGAILARIVAVGYTPVPPAPDALRAAIDREKSDLLIRFGTAAFLSMQVMTFAAGLYAGEFQGMDAPSSGLFRWLSFALTTPVILYAAGPFYRGALAELRRGIPGMDSLVSLGALAAYGYSAGALVTGAEVFFDTAGMIVAFLLLGRYLEAVARGRALDTVSRLLGLAPRRARRVPPGAALPASSAETVPAAAVRRGDVLEVRPGETVPADGRIVLGETETDEALLTGESRPVPRIAGNEVFAGTVNIGGRIYVAVDGAGRDTVLGRIVRAVEEARAGRSPAQRMADAVAGLFVPLVLAIAAATLAGWVAAGVPFHEALLRAVAVLVIACPCALGLATPLAATVASATAQGLGIHVRTPEAFERGAAVTHVFLDKTGTVTTGTPRISDVRSLGMPAGEALRFAAAVDAPSTHPLAAALRAASGAAAIPAVEGFVAHPGRGVEGTVEGAKILLGHTEFLASRGIPVDGPARAAEAELAAGGRTVVGLAADARLAALIAAADMPRAEAPECVRRLRAADIGVLLLTGDGEEAARATARAAGIPEVLSRQDPFGKIARVREARERGCVVLVAGDGVNDAPALATADVGLAMGTGTAVAAESASVVLMKNDLRLVPAFLDLSRRASRIIRQNLFWAFSYNAVAIPLAVLGRLHPIVAAALMATSSLVVVGNSLRLRRA